MRRSGPAVLAVTAAVLIAGLSAVAPARAQAPTPADRIMAVVGDDILLVSEWREQSLLLAAQLEIQPDSEEFERLARETYAQMLRDMVIVAAAERDTTIKLSEDLILEEVDREIDQIRRRFPSEDEFLRQLRQSQWGGLAAYRADLRERKRNELLGQALLERRRPEIEPRPVTDAEVRAYWEERRDVFGPTRERLRFEEIPVAVEPTEEARRAAREKAERALEEIQGGQDFATAARQFSADSASARLGGDLGWFGRGRMVSAFEEAAFEAAPGEVVGPLETPYGWHLIQVLDRRPEEVRARHILIVFETTAADRERARQRAEALREAIDAGADVDSLQAELAAADPAAAEVLEFDPAELPVPYVRMLEDLEPDRAGVVETPTGFSVVVSRGATGGEPASFEEVEERIRVRLAQQKAEEAFVRRLEEEVYVQVRLRPEDVL